MRHPTGDPKRSRVFVVVSRQALMEVPFSTVICAPVVTTRSGLSTQVDIGVDEGLKHDSTIQCDALSSLPKRVLSDYVGRLGWEKVRQLDQALAIAAGID